MSSIASNLQEIRQQIRLAAKAYGRSENDIMLLAVSKTFDAHAILEAAKAGQTAFGENYLQEALDKMADLAQITAPLQALQPTLEWHFIGPIQSNKTRQIAENFAWVHAIDRLKIAERLSSQRGNLLPPLNICLQINISQEETKAGIDPEHVLPLAQQIVTLPNLRLRGLMAIPEPAQTLEMQRKPYLHMRQILQELQQYLPNHAAHLDTLSMGMSADFQAAIAEGSTIVRIGSALFGMRA